MSPLLPGMLTGSFEFTTVGPAGVAAAPDAAPTAVLLVNGVAAGSLAVTGTGTGTYVAGGATVPASAPHAATLTARVASYAFAGVPAGPKYKDLGVVDLNGVFEFGQARAGSSSGVTLKAGATSAALASRAAVEIVAGPGAGQTGFCVAYNATTKALTVDSAWATPPTSASFYAVRWATPLARGSASSSSPAVDFAALLALALTGSFEDGTVGRLFQRLSLSYGALRLVRVVSGTAAASVGQLVVRPAEGEPPLPATGMVRTPPRWIASLTGGQAVQKAQITGWRLQPDNATVLVSLNQPWPGEPAADDLMMIY